jgi:hypothetical protein
LLFWLPAPHLASVTAAAALPWFSAFLGRLWLLQQQQSMLQLSQPAGPAAPDNLIHSCCCIALHS